MTKSSINSNMVRELARLLDEENLSEIEYDTGTLRVRLARTIAFPQGAGMVTGMRAPAVSAAEVPIVDFASNPGTIKAPMVGLAYLGPEPGAAPFVKIGDVVTIGDTLVLIEAMKTFNPVRASHAGRVTRIFINDGAPVEFGEPLLLVE
ncbi:MAG: acetyl-CoA carboxylase biotin carboxyl carrier protein [Alphaproteobacteria bacterium]|nr:acetyl-CoA carboxylase biotin carboxyl carrier protein [Alphaproteobacteria bacterium]